MATIATVTLPVVMVPGEALCATAIPRKQRLVTIDPKMQMNLLPTRWRMAYMPQLTPTKPMQVIMIEYWKACLIPAIWKKYV
jgi:hypothetical protein